MPGRQRIRLRRGFTLIEMVIVVALMGVIVALAAPSLAEVIQMQRLRGVQAQLVTDMQFARSEAISRNTVLRVDFRNTSQFSCYTLYTAPFVQGPAGPCDCTQGAGNACNGLPNRKEIRTVQVPASSGVTVKALEVPDQCYSSFGFDPATGGLLSNPNDDGPTAIDDFRIDVYLDNARKLRTWMERSGRPTVCTPTGATMPEAACLAAVPCIAGS